MTVHIEILYFLIIKNSWTIQLKGVNLMGSGTIIILAVIVTFLTAIFTAGYNDKPGLK